MVLTTAKISGAEQIMKDSNNPIVEPSVKTLSELIRFHLKDPKTTHKSEKVPPLEQRRPESSDLPAVWVPRPASIAGGEPSPGVPAVCPVW